MYYLKGNFFNDFFLSNTYVLDSFLDRQIDNANIGLEDDNDISINEVLSHVVNLYFFLYEEKKYLLYLGLKINNKIDNYYKL